MHRQLPSPRRTTPVAATLAALACSAASLAAQTALPAPPPEAAATALRAGRPIPTLQAVRLQGATPRLDGRLDEALWQQAPVAGDFVVFEPRAGDAPAFPTEARVVFDDEAVYVGIRMHDASPDSIVGRLARRDTDVYSDWVYVALDSYGDRRTGFVFGVNPAGVKRDILMYDDVMETPDWDAVWEAAARVDADGWTAEFRIPLSQLRFAPDGQVPWGFEVMRNIARLNETSVWAPLAREVNGMVSRFGELRGMEGLQPSRSLEILPYSLARLDRGNGSAEDPYFRRTDPAGGIGADVKVGLTSNLTLNATLNPDFGQVEADPSVVNLSAYETFLPEKRPFFVEGADIYRFGIGLGDGDLGNEGLFYSRRIGRSPRGEAPDAAEWSTAPTQTTILGAAKLSGKTAGGWSLGVLEAATQAEHARWTAPGGERGETLVEPFTNYAVGRLIRDFRQGRSAVGFIGTAVNRSMEAEAVPSLHTAAYTTGVNARHRWGGASGNDFSVSTSVVGSHVRGSADAIARTQRSSARYFQRPDADHLEYDPTRTSLSGWMSSTEFTGQDGNLRYLAALNVRSPGFEVNDLGYQQEADQALAVGWMGYRMHTPGAVFRRWGVNLNAWSNWTFGGEHTGLGGNVNGDFQFHSRWGGWLGVNRQQPGLSTGALRGGPAMRSPGRLSGWGGFYSDDRKPVQMELGFNWNVEPETDGHGVSLNPSVRVRPSDRSQLSLGANVSRSSAAWQWVGRRGSTGGTHYLFAGLEQRVVGLTARLAYTVSPTLSLEVYAQPFLAAGDYQGFMEVAAPRAATFAERFARFTDDQVSAARDADGDLHYAVDVDRDGSADLSFADPDFNVRAFTSNAVVRWEYRPGSTLFLVWSQGRNHSADRGDFDFTRDGRALFDQRAENVFLVKFSYWLGL